METVNTLSQLFQRKSQAAPIPRSICCPAPQPRPTFIPAGHPTIQVVVEDEKRYIDYNVDPEHDLPFGWEIRKDRDGKKYYLDHLTQTTTWEKPRALPEGWEERVSEEGKKWYIDHNTETTHWRLPTRLPEGWEERITEEGKRWYIDHNTETTHWHLPKLGDGAMVPYRRN
jgi:uncharacterized protein YbdZ (MbtH family)